MNALQVLIIQFPGQAAVMLLLEFNKKFKVFTVGIQLFKEQVNFYHFRWFGWRFQSHYWSGNAGGQKYRGFP